ncbi:MAG: RES family NAD+ phosphorylase [Aquabacterium sp.]
MTEIGAQRCQQSPWQSSWFEDGSSRSSMSAWRGVEAQHVVSTMRLVDNLAEQDVLEQILEGSKPAAPDHPPGQHYLLYTPFRYRPAQASRFRAAGTLGLWYGAKTVETACAEVAYWRWRFVMDSAGLINHELVTEHTFFQAEVDGLAIALTKKPWVESRDLWTAPNDYSYPQKLAAAASEAGIDWIKYESVRDPGGVCAVVLVPKALSMGAAAPRQTWHCKASRSYVMMRCEGRGLEWRF